MSLCQTHLRSRACKTRSSIFIDGMGNLFGLAYCQGSDRWKISLFAIYQLLNVFIRERKPWYYWKLNEVNLAKLTGSPAGPGRPGAPLGPCRIMIEITLYVYSNATKKETHQKYSKLNEK